MISGPGSGPAAPSVHNTASAGFKWLQYRAPDNAAIQ